MIKHYITLTLVFILTGCGRSTSIPATFISDISESPPIKYANIQSIDPVINPYYQTFLKAAAERSVTLDPVRIDNLIIKFGVTSDRQSISPGYAVVGFCAPTTSETGLSYIVTLDQQQWLKSSDLDRQFLLFHELGHCVLNRNHKSDLEQIGRPSSIMYPTLFSTTGMNSSIYFKYLEELFRNR